MLSPFVSAEEIQYFIYIQEYIELHTFPALHLASIGCCFYMISYRLNLEI
jgi:hypothetical protein